MIYLVSLQVHSKNKAQIFNARNTWDKIKRNSTIHTGQHQIDFIRYAKSMMLAPPFSQFTIIYKIGRKMIKFIYIYKKVIRRIQFGPFRGIHIFQLGNSALAIGKKKQVYCIYRNSRKEKKLHFIFECNPDFEERCYLVKIKVG